MAPLIAITPDCGSVDGAPTEATYIVRQNYAAAIAAAGGLPVILPYLPERLAEVVERFDGFLISGSTPGSSNLPDRTEFELALIAAAGAQGKPVLGICNGMQIIGLALGGTLIDRLPTPDGDGPDHMPQPAPTEVAHDLALAPYSRLSRLAGGTAAVVNSLHRQAVRADGRFRVTARAPDDVVEGIEGGGIEGEGSGYMLGVQWHPEYRLTDLDRALLADFVIAARIRSAA